MKTNEFITGNCLFCNTNSVKITKTKTKSQSFVKIFALGKSESFDESEMDCPVCFRKYKAFSETNKEYFKKHVVFSDLMLSDLIRFFPNTERNSLIDSIFSNFIGIAQMKRSRILPKEYSIIFELEHKRAYLHCKTDKKDFKVISVNEV